MAGSAFVSGEIGSPFRNLDDDDLQIRTSRVLCTPERSTCGNLGEIRKRIRQVDETNDHEISTDHDRDNLLQCCGNDRTRCC